jgi:release factor glutamine methyltransferase
MRKTGSVTDIASGEVAGRVAEAPVSGLVAELVAVLESAGVPEPWRVSADIVAALLDVPRSWASMNRDATVDTGVAIAARSAARRLAAGAPFAYAVGRAQFRHLSLEVDARVLIPRPETEVLVDEILSRFRSTAELTGNWGIAVDIGTGSGAIALSLAAEGRFSRVVATDNSMDALVVANRNASLAGASLRCPVEFRPGSLLSPVRDIEARLLVSNPPYVSFGEADGLPASVRNWEPPTALYSGSSGLDATAAIVQEGASLLASGGILALEVDERRASLVAEMVMTAVGYIDVGVVLDLTGRERFVFASRA